jgi:hypothetical protein
MPQPGITATHREPGDDDQYDDPQTREEHRPASRERGEPSHRDQRSITPHADPGMRYCGGMFAPV